MKEIRPRFSDVEYDQLKSEANQCRISVQQLVHDRAVNVDPADSSLHGAQILSDGMASIRADLNQIIRRETSAEIRLYDDDIIQLEMSMADLEQVVSKYLAQVSRMEVKRHGQFAV